MKRRLCGAVLLRVLLCAMTLPAAAAGTSLRLEGPETLPAEGESFTLRRARLAEDTFYFEGEREGKSAFEAQLIFKHL